jgi:hypothetical protein
MIPRPDGAYHFHLTKNKRKIDKNDARWYESETDEASDEEDGHKGRGD